MIFLSVLKKKFEIDLNSFTYESKGEEYLKTIVPDETCFRKDNKTSIIPNENSKYNCRVLLQIQSVYYNMKGKDILNDDVKYHPQLFIEQCG